MGARVYNQEDAVIKVHLKQGGSITASSTSKGEWKIKYHGSVRFLEVHEADKFFSVPMENVLFIEEILN